MIKIAVHNINFPFHGDFLYWDDQLKEFAKNINFDNQYSLIRFTGVDESKELKPKELKPRCKISCFDGESMTPTDIFFKDKTAMFNYILELNSNIRGRK